MRTLALVFLSFALVSCSNSSQTTNNATASAPEANVKNEVIWYEDDLSKPINKVGVLDAEGIIKNANVKVYGTDKSTDPNGELRNIYILGKSNLDAKVAISPSTLVISWFQVNESESSLTQSQESLKAAYAVARSALGDEGKEAIRRISRGGMFKGEPVAGYPANGSCVSGLCILSLKTRI